MSANTITNISTKSEHVESEHLKAEQINLTGRIAAAEKFFKSQSCSIQKNERINKIYKELLVRHSACTKAQNVLKKAIELFDYETSNHYDNYCQAMQAAFKQVLKFYEEMSVSDTVFRYYDNLPEEKLTEIDELKQAQDFLVYSIENFDEQYSNHIQLECELINLIDSQYVFFIACRENHFPLPSPNK